MIKLLEELIKPFYMFINLARTMFTSHLLPMQGGGSSNATNETGDPPPPPPNTAAHPNVQKTLAKMEAARAKMAEYGIKHISEREALGFRFACEPIKQQDVKNVMR